MKTFLVIACVGLLSSCGKSISGTYGGDECIFEKMNFKSDGTVTVTMLRTDVVGQYTIDGDRVRVVLDGDPIEFTRKGNALVAWLELGTCVQ